MPLGTLGKLHGRHFDHTVLLRRISDMDTLVDGKTCDLTEIMVRMGTDRADTVRAEGHPFRITTVNLIEFLFAKHMITLNFAQ